VPILPDDQFERYLKQFRPVAPEQMRLAERRLAGQRTRRMVAWSAVAAVAIVVMAPVLRVRHGRSDSVGIGSAAGAEQLVNVQPLTMGSATTLLVTAPSFETAINQMAFQSKATPLSKGTHSALAELSKDELAREMTKL
jgi:hypothetical protein